MALELGYYFYPPDYLETLGPCQMMVNLYQEPTLRHFDPEKAIFLVIEPDGEVKPTTLVHPWSGPDSFHICAGRITLIDRREKVVEAFSLGGELRITSYPDHTHCVLTSVTPIAELVEGESILSLLVAEFEVLLAQKLAEWGQDETGFRRRLAIIDPYVLLVAALAAVQKRLEDLPLTGTYQHTTHALNEAIRTLQQEGRWPAVLPDLDELL